MFKNTLKGTGLVIWVAIVGVVLAIGGWELRVHTADIKGKGDAQIQILSGSNRIVAYNHFFDLCASVQNAEAGLDAQFDQLAATTDSDQRDRILTNITALKTNRLIGINQYNADAQKDYTIGQFRDLKLPYSLAATAYDTKGSTKTSCAS